jgi:hypothetical protein
MAGAMENAARHQAESGGSWAQRPQRPALWRVSGVSIPGFGHLGEAAPCQDAHRHYIDPTAGTVVLAVADGAGSEERSSEGSALAVGTAIEVLKKRLGRSGPPHTDVDWQVLLEEATEEIFTRFLRVVDQVLLPANGEPSEGSGVWDPPADREALATTLTVVVLAVPWLGFISLGDGFVVVETEFRDLHLVIPPQHDGMYVNETTFLTSANGRARTRVEHAWEPSVTGVALCTDGLAQSSLDYGPGNADGPLRAHHDYFAEVFQHAATHRVGGAKAIAQHFLSAEMERLTIDDKTLLLAVRDDRP